MTKTKSQKNQGRRLGEDVAFLERIKTIHPHLIKYFGNVHYRNKIYQARQQAKDLNREDLVKRLDQL